MVQDYEFVRWISAFHHAFVFIVKKRCVLFIIYCFTAVCVGVLVGVTPITKGPPPQIYFFWVACVLFPRSLAFDFCYDLDIWGQGQALRAFFVVLSFSLFYQKYEGDFDQTWQEAS